MHIHVISDHLKQYQMRHTQRPDRPSSAKRRTQPGLGDTLRPGEGNKWMKSSSATTKPKHESPPPVRGAVSYDSPRFGKQPTQSQLDDMFGNTSKSRMSPQLRKSPIDEDSYGKSRASPSQGLFPQARKSPVNEDPYGKSRSSPKEGLFPQTRMSPVDEDRYDKYNNKRASPKEGLFSSLRKSPVHEEAYDKQRETQKQMGMSLPKNLPGSGDRKSPGVGDRKSPLTKEPSKEDLIFGRKTPTKEQ